MAQFARTQPQGLARINRSHPLAKNLRFAFIPGVGSVAGTYSTVVAATSTTTGPRGRYTQTLGSGPYPTYSGVDASTAASAFSVVLCGDFSAPGSYTAPILTLVTTSGSNGWKIGTNSNGAVGYTAYSIADYAGSVSVSAAKTIGVSIALNGTASVYLDGVSRDSFSVGGLNGVTAGQFCIGSRYPSTDSTSNSRVAVALYFDRLLTAAEHASIAANPWQLFDAPSQTQFPRTAAAGTGAALSGAASAVASVTGGLTTSIPLAASAAVVASASASLSTQIALTASAAAQAAASASLSTQIALTGSASASASASASLSTQIALSGSAAAAATASATLTTGSSISGAAVASASASAALTTAIALAGSSSAAASASGTLSTGIALTGAASAQATASAALTAGSGMSGSASAQASASATLSTAIALAGAAIAQAQASASLSGQAAALAGSASASASASAQLTTGISLSGAAQAQASGQAALSTQIALVAIAQAQASAWAQFAPTHAPTMRIYAINAESRSQAINAQGRSYAVDAQTRTNTT